MSVKKYTKADFKRYGVCSELDNKIFSQISEFKDLSFKLSQLDKAIHELNEELFRLNFRRSRFIDRRLAIMDELYDLFFQKHYEGIDEDKLATVVDLLNKVEKGVESL